VWVVDARTAPENAGSKASISALGSPATPAVTWTVRNKIDLVVSEHREQQKNEFILSNIDYSISANTGEGVDQLIDSLGQYASEFFGSEPALISRERHRTALQTTLAALDRALLEGIAGREDIIAEELRTSANILGRLLGRVDVEDILDVIFRDFCIGK